VAESVKVLKAAAKTRKVPAPEVLSALATIKKAKLDTSAFFQTLGGTESPGRTWMLIFTAQGRLEKGSYFPVTAVQRFDAAVSSINLSYNAPEPAANTCIRNSDNPLLREWLDIYASNSQFW
jgi:hypothetical protein